MKTSLLIALFGTAVCLNAAAQSTVETATFKASVFPIPNSSTIRVLVSKEAGKKFYLTVRDGKNNLIHHDGLTKRATQHRFDLNLSELANGKYYIDLSDGNQPLVTKIIVKEQAVQAQPIVSNQIVCLN